ncbi:hypothetical protein MKK70_27935 [Methylobacterium sp. E-041]|uniref:hypothetical protein n=1 Tax=Methylobacterium sp. E-041 TaxID=2836573 RepID=UPI001FBA2431|nr:hypothetical protein [Methylobacterium sp. E-041]MCJ2109133.1 hypothetical protein [Methylobacterium sp. E-041]
MPHQSGPLLTDNALDALARRWFAEVWAEHAETRMNELQRDVAGDVGAGALDWLFGDSDSDTAGDDGGF